MSEYSQQFCISAEHPSLSGHFPGNPIVPGVVILDYVQLALRQWQQSVRIKTFVQVKFLQPLSPEQIFKVSLIQVSPVSVKFECACGVQKLVIGAFTLAEKK